MLAKYFFRSMVCLNIYFQCSTTIDSDNCKKSFNKDQNTILRCTSYSGGVQLFLTEGHSGLAKIFAGPTNKILPPNFTDENLFWPFLHIKQFFAFKFL